MKYVLILVAAVVMFAGCGHIIGNDPEGVTGGHMGGYGAYGTSFSGDYYPLILGNWQQDGQQGDHNVINFKADGTVKVDFYVGNEQHSSVGGYFVSGNRLDINVTGWLSGSQTMTVNEGNITLAGNDGSIVLHK
jgi:hypothetical protein